MLLLLFVSVNSLCLFQFNHLQGNEFPETEPRFRVPSLPEHPSHAGEAIIGVGVPVKRAI